jgi:hypothetical protein
VSVAVEVDFEGGLLGSGQGSLKAAGAVEEIVDARGELRIVGDFRCDLGAHVSACVMESSVSDDPIEGSDPSGPYRMFTDSTESASDISRCSGRKDLTQ